MDVQRLRRETSVEHEAVERTVPFMEPELQRDEYVFSLIRMYGIVSAWEQAAAQRAPHWLRGDLAARTRLGFLKEDLEFFGIQDFRVDQAALPDMTVEAELLGSMYVMEGSTLGGQIIARHVEERLNLRAGFGNAFFRGHASRTGALWKEFCEVLRTRIPEDQSELAIKAAREMFQVFGAWMKRPNSQPSYVK